MLCEEAVVVGKFGATGAALPSRRSQCWSVGVV